MRSGRDPHSTGLDLDEVARSFAELHELAGLVSTHSPRSIGRPMAQLPAQRLE